MRRGLLALCLVASMVLAGCLGPSSADWGTGSDAVNVELSMENTAVNSGLSGQSTTTNVIPVGCTPGSEGGELDESTGSPISFTGYLAASHFYDAHNDMARNLDFGVTTAVAIHAMSFSDAAAVNEGEGARIDVKNWFEPLYPKTGAGSVNLEKVDSDSETKWFVLGLIPTTENVLNGMTSLNEWHQPVTVHGYMVSQEGDGNNPIGYLKDWHTASNDCSLMVKSINNREDLYVLVTGITLEGATVSASGEAGDEWVHGDVPLLGRGAFILFFLAGGIGGAVGLFIVSRGMVMKSASKSMATLIGTAGMKKAASVKSDAKAAKKAGMESPTERKARMDKERAKEMKKEKAPSSPAKNENPLGGFDLDSVLASTSTSQAPGGAAPTGRKSSVVVTEAAENMDRMQAEETPASSLPASISQRRSSSPPSTKPNSVGGPPKQREEAKSKPPVRRRKAVKKAAPEEETPAPAPPSYDDEEDFSDFSF
jgi:hypothetical protein